MLVKAFVFDQSHWEFLILCSSTFGKKCGSLQRLPLLSVVYWKLIRAFGVKNHFLGFLLVGGTGNLLVEQFQEQIAVNRKVNRLAEPARKENGVGNAQSVDALYAGEP